MNLLPIEIQFKILNFLSLSDLLSIKLVNYHYYNLYNDNYIWKCKLTDIPLLLDDSNLKSFYLTNHKWFNNIKLLLSMKIDKLFWNYLTTIVKLIIKDGPIYVDGHNDGVKSLTVINICHRINKDSTLIISDDPKFYTAIHPLGWIFQVVILVFNVKILYISFKIKYI